MSVPDSELQVILPLSAVRAVAVEWCGLWCCVGETHQAECLVPLLEEHDLHQAAHPADDHEVRPDWHDIHARYPVRCRTCERPVTSAASVPGRPVVWRHIT